MVRIYWKSGKSWSSAQLSAGAQLIEWLNGADIHPGTPAYLVSGAEEYTPEQFEQSGSAQVFGDVRKHVVDSLAKAIPSLHP